MYAANQVLDQCDSTNTVAKELAEAGFPHGTWVSSRVQNLGRGRLGREWKSLEGNLFLSLIATVEKKTLWSWIPLTTAVGTVRLLRRLYPDLDIRVKWPNDIWLRSAKLGGILCEASPFSTPPYIIIGLGLNCAHSPEGLDQEAIDLTQAQGGRLITADHVREKVISSILDEIDRLELNGPQTIIESYASWAAYPAGTEVKWTASQSSNQEEYSGTIQGLGPSGELQVTTSQNETVSLFAEDIKIKNC